MKTQDVKCGKTYSFDNKTDVIVVRKILGKETKKQNMQSGIMFIGYKREKKKF